MKRNQYHDDSMKIFISVFNSSVKFFIYIICPLVLSLNDIKLNKA